MSALAVILIVVGVVLAIVVALVALQVPELRRYLKMRSM
jgi:uncharacterized membrane protein YgaE (UPF0421/DUF939 family)